eukprot:CAMPEP_0170747802 /NCGR_PEP_ID=MMETSP0437-20130122/9514_1 /TAXON_ID=0 /ORGANISM="Sexangularia sp." /LENGTH=106 /DNA_ID=CAMNT_0011086599 /DNA_START=77 /DNA_END=397 /DNA_ORIENTATION=-
MKIEIFVSTATSSQKIKKDVQALQSLLEKKKISVPELTWTATDVAADRADLERMWAQADGKRDLPQLHIDDKFVGTYDDLMEKEEVGQLDEILGYKGAGDVEIDLS